MINKLVEKIKKTGAPIVVGLDPMLSYIPQHILDKAYAEYGETLEGAAEAVWQFNKEIVDKTYDLIPAVKPQIAMYEQFGIPGLEAFKKTVDYCKSKDLVVMESIGMTKKQKRKMFFWEGNWYFLLMEVLVLTVGTGILWLVRLYMEKQAVYFRFQYPAGWLAGISLGMLGILAGSCCSFRRGEKVHCTQ